MSLNVRNMKAALQVRITNFLKHEIIKANYYMIVVHRPWGCSVEDPWGGSFKVENINKKIPKKDKLSSHLFH